MSSDEEEKFSPPAGDAGQLTIAIESLAKAVEENTASVRAQTVANNNMKNRY